MHLRSESDCQRSQFSVIPGEIHRVKYHRVNSFRIKRNEMEVSVLLTTYNHEKYIAQALDSVLMQETNFDFELVILEDCSTDSTRDIVLAYQKKHPRKIRLRLAKRNVHSNKPFAEEFQAAPSPYIAMLDGDDYWSSPAKLQKQVEFLKVHPDYMLCFHNALRVY